MKHDLQGIFDALHEGVVILDASGRIELLNSEAARLFGAPKELLPGKVFADAVGARHPAVAIVERVRLSGRASIHDEIEFPNRHAAPIPVDVAVSRLGEDTGEATGIAIALRDRSARAR